MIRHGHALNNELQLQNATPVKSFQFPLTNLGVDQVEQASKKIQEEFNLNNDTVSWILTSPLHRTLETASILANKLRIHPEKIVTEYGLIEMGTGTLEGKPTQDDKLGDQKMAEAYAVETKADLNLRMRNLIEKLGKLHPKQTLILVTHRSPLEAILKHIGNVEDRAKLDSGKYPSGIIGNADYRMIEMEDAK